MAIQDDAKNFLLSALSRAGGDLPSLQMEWLATQGYTRGTIDDRWQAYLSANAYYLPEGLSRLLVGLNRAIGNNWTPNLLFQSGDILLWYDPSDLTTMFKDTIGTQPVTADGDSVALMLDKGQWGGKSLTQVLAAQPELVTNGGFGANITGWTDASTGTGTFAWNSGTARITHGASGTGRMRQALTTVAGRWYKVSFDAVMPGTRSCFHVGTTAGATNLLAVQSFTTGSRSFKFLATSTTSWLNFFTSTASDVYDFDNISVKEIPGYHRVQATGTSMPKYKTDGTLHWLLYDGTDDGHATGTIPFNTVTSDGAARRNLLVEPDKFDHSTWVKDNVTVTANTVAAPDGATTADKLAETTATGVHRAYQAYTFTGVQTHTFSCYLKAGERSWAMLIMGTTAFGGDKSAYFDLANGVVGTVASGTTANITSVGDGWYRCAITANSISGTLTTSYRINIAQTNNTASYAGTTGHGIYTWGAQLDVGSTATDFQNIGTDEVSVCAGVTKSSDISGVIVEHSASIASNNGAFSLINVTVSPSAWRFAAKGTTQSDALGSNLAAPLTSVLTGQGKIATDLSTLRRDGVQTSTSATDQGTGNFGSYPMYFGRRGGSSLPFNGREYQTVIRSRLLSAAELSSLETFVAAKTGVIL